ncbi:MAG: hypothetical protein M3163_00710, partial [Actinomycetota bacterium]|nr:hypothetical protein [Actinomycetota bacterium]
MCTESRSPCRPLVLEGASGTGKSFLLAAMAGELLYSAQRPVVTYHGADLADGALTARASPMPGELPAALLIDDVDALATAPRLMSPLGTLLGRLCDRGTRVAMACHTWTPDLDILLSLSTAGGVPATRVRCLPPD